MKLHLPTIAVILNLVLAGCSTSAPRTVATEQIVVSPVIRSGEDVEFLKHSGPKEFDTYLAMNLPFVPAKEVFEQVKQSEGKKLITRGEAHITVITPVEFWSVLKLKPALITIEEIDKIATDMGIQKSRFEVVCLGMGKLPIGGVEHKTFYLVTESEDLLNIRRAVEKLYLSRGGKPGAFKAEHFFPHITIGYTERDLHESDGVTKDRNSCVSSVVEVPSQN